MAKLSQTERALWNTIRKSVIALDKKVNRRKKKVTGKVTVHVNADHSPKPQRDPFGTPRTDLLSDDGE